MSHTRQPNPIAQAEPSAVSEGATFISPGLVDAHCHIGLGPGGAVDDAELRRQCAAEVAIGVTLVRDLGVPRETAGVCDQLEAAPRIIRCGQHIARPMRYLRGFAREIEVRELPEVVAHEAAKGDGWVKIVGDWIDRSDGAESDLAPLWPREVLTEAVAAAHSAGARLTVHTFARASADDLLAAGVDGIEHGTGLDSDHLDECARRGIIMCPTALTVNTFCDIAGAAGDKYPRYRDHMLAMYHRRAEQMAAIFESGAPIVMGSDAGGTIAHGSLVDELFAARELLAPIGDYWGQIVDAATWRGRELVLGEDSAVSAEGASVVVQQKNIRGDMGSDAVVYRADPRIDPQALRHPLKVIIGGQVVAGELAA